jgi:hypothetical protein
MNDYNGSEQEASGTESEIIVANDGGEIIDDDREDSEAERIQQLAEEHDISWHVPVVPAWREADSEAEFVEAASELDQSATIDVDVPEAIVKAAEARVELYDTDDETRVEQEILQMVQFELQY